MNTNTSLELYQSVVLPSVPEKEGQLVNPADYTRG